MPCPQNLRRLSGCPAPNTSAQECHHPVHPSGHQYHGCHQTCILRVISIMGATKPGARLFSCCSVHSTAIMVAPMI
eukprot:1139101-Pelagomonas_calceolata.AAC.2